MASLISHNDCRLGKDLKDMNFYEESPSSRQSQAMKEINLKKHFTFCLKRDFRFQSRNVSVESSLKSLNACEGFSATLE